MIRYRIDEIRYRTYKEEGLACGERHFYHPDLASAGPRAGRLERG